MAAKYGMEGIELFYEDLADLARPVTAPNLLAAAAYIRSLCASLDLEIICLQPFMHYEGLVDRQKHALRVEEMRLWIQLAHTLGTDLIQIPSSFLPAEEISSDLDIIVSDLRKLADMGLEQKPTIRFAYESLCWGTYSNTWEDSWSVVQRVDRPNFGLCLDSFNILGRIYADPSAHTRCMPDAEYEVDSSMKRLVAQVGPHKEKIFFIQVVDAERLAEPLTIKHPLYNVEQPARMSWSRNCRLFYGETDRRAYLPVRQVVDTIINEIGYRGWVSMELFNRRMESSESDVVEELASRAALGWMRMTHDLGLVVGGKKIMDGKEGTDRTARL